MMRSSSSQSITKPSDSQEQKWVTGTIKLLTAIENHKKVCVDCPHLAAIVAEARRA